MVRDAVPNPVRPGWLVLQRLWAAFLVQVVPAVEGGARDPKPLQGAADRQVRPLDQADDLKLLGGWVPHSWSAPSAIKLFLSSRSSSACSATTSLRVRAS